MFEKTSLILSNIIKLCILTFLTKYAISQSIFSNDVIFNNGIFLVGGKGDNGYPLVRYSYDGKKWFDSKINNSGLNLRNINISGIACSEKNICAAAIDNNMDVNHKMLYSNDNGRTWNITNSAISNCSNSYVVFANNRFVGIDSCTGFSTEPSIQYSLEDATMWLPSSKAVVPNADRITAGAGIFVAMNFPSINNVWMSLDGADWKTINLPPELFEGLDLDNIKYMNGKFFILPLNSNVIYTTKDFIYYSKINLNDKISGLEYQGNLYYGSFIGSSKVSPDLVHWYDMKSEISIHIPTPSSSSQNHLAYGNKIYVYANGVSNLEYSYDGITWLEVMDK